MAFYFVFPRTLDHPQAAALGPFVPTGPTLRGFPHISGLAALPHPICRPSGTTTNLPLASAIGKPIDRVVPEKLASLSTVSG